MSTNPASLVLAAATTIRRKEMGVVRVTSECLQRRRDPGEIQLLLRHAQLLFTVNTHQRRPTSRMASFSQRLHDTWNSLRTHSAPASGVHVSPGVPAVHLAQGISTGIRASSDLHWGFHN